MCCVVVSAVAQSQDVVFVARALPLPMMRFHATTREQLPDFNFRNLSQAVDIVACYQTSQLYVLDNSYDVWRIAADGINRELLLEANRVAVSRPHRGLALAKIQPHALSVWSSRLLVTLYDEDKAKQSEGQTVADYLIQLDAGGHELRRVNLPVEMSPTHAVESPTGTIIVSNSTYQLEESCRRHRISEVDMDGRVLRHFAGSRLLKLGSSVDIAIDSHGNVFVADDDNSHILLLDARLTPRRIIIDKHQLNHEKKKPFFPEMPWRLCYMEHTGQLLVLTDHSVAVFDVLCR